MWWALGLSALLLIGCSFTTIKFGKEPCLDATIVINGECIETDQSGDPAKRKAEDPPRPPEGERPAVQQARAQS